MPKDKPEFFCERCAKRPGKYLSRAQLVCLDCFVEIEEKKQEKKDKKKWNLKEKLKKNLKK